MDIEDCDGDLAEIEQIFEARANTAAAEVWEPGVPIHPWIYRTEANELIAATIERCAQVAKETAKHWNVPDVVAEHIAAAIRALKDKP